MRDFKSRTGLDEAIEDAIGLIDSNEDLSH